MWPFDSVLFSQGILPFLLVFVLIFAILQKSKILGDGKAQIDSLVSLAIALILIATPVPRQIIVDFMPWLAVAAVVILVFLILYGFVAGDLTKVPQWMKVVFGILIGLFTIGLVVVVTGLWPIFKGWLDGGGNEFWGGVIMLIIIAGAIAVAVTSGKNGGSSE
jgi:hypothetical protein